MASSVSNSTSPISTPKSGSSTRSTPKGGTLSLVLFRSRPGRAENVSNSPALTYIVVISPGRPSGRGTFRAGRTHPVPLIIGTNDTEGRFFELPGLRLDLLASDERAEAVFAATQPELREQVLAVYRGSRFRRDLGGDYMFWHPSVQLMESHPGPVYAHRYDIRRGCCAGSGYAPPTR